MRKKYLLGLVLSLFLLSGCFYGSPGSNPDVDDATLEAYNMLGELSVADRELEIDLLSSQGISILRDIVNVTGSASIPVMANSTSGELMLRTGSTPNSTAILDSADMGRYNPGSVGQVGVGFRTLSRPVGTQEWKVGYFDGEDGFYMGENSSCLYVALISNGVEERVCESDWNGRNVSEVIGRDWTPNDGQILQIDYSWYGYGAIRFSLVETGDVATSRPGEVQQVVPIHTFVPINHTSVSNPIQHIRVLTRNGADGGSYEIRVGGRQYSIYGSPSSVKRIINAGDTRQSVNSSSFECVASFKRDDDNFFKSRELQFYGLDVLSDSANAEFVLLYNPNLTGSGSYENPVNTDFNETALRVNRNCTFASVSGEDVLFNSEGGLEIWSEFVAASQQGGKESPGGGDVGDVNIKLPGGRELALAARSLDGTTTVVDTNVRFLERR